MFFIHGPKLSVAFCAYCSAAASRVRYAGLWSALDPATGHQQTRTSCNSHAPKIRPAIFTRISTATHDCIADWRRASRRALVEILNRLLDVADALLHLPGNLF